MLSYIQVFVFATLLLIPTHQSIPEEGDDTNVDTWKNSEGIQVESYFPSDEDRESLLRDLRSLRARYYRPRSSSFPYYKGLGRK